MTSPVAVVSVKSPVRYGAKSSSVPMKYSPLGLYSDWWALPSGGDPAGIGRPVTSWSISGSSGAKSVSDSNTGFAGSVTSRLR